MNSLSQQTPVQALSEPSAFPVHHNLVDHLGNYWLALSPILHRVGALARYLKLQDPLRDLVRIVPDGRRKICCEDRILHNCTRVEACYPFVPKGRAHLYCLKAASRVPPAEPGKAGEAGVGS
jgi:hypothetical protein